MSAKENPNRDKPSRPFPSLAADRFDDFLFAYVAPINIARFLHLLVLIRNCDSSIEFQFRAFERSNRLIDVRISKTFVLQIVVDYARECKIKLSGIFRCVAIRNGISTFLFNARHSA
jgi:hypothetical protein